MLKPLQDYLLIKPVFPPVQSAAGLYVQSTALAMPTRGKVLAIGPGKRDAAGELIPMPDLRVNNVVAFSAGSLEQHSYRDDNGKRSNVYLLKAENIIGVEPYYAEDD